MTHPQVRALLDRPQIPQRTPEWFRIRKTMITASEAAAVLDIKPFDSYQGSPRAAIMKEKTRVDDGPGIDNVFTRHGQKYEDEARDIYCAMTGETVYEFGLIAHSEHPWLGCSVDGVTDTGYVLEIKCPLSRKIEPGTVPEHYYPQVQMCMEVCDLDEARFIQYKPESITWPKDKEFDVVMVPRNREWFAEALPKLRRFFDDMNDLKQTMAADPAADPAVEPAAAVPKGAKKPASCLIVDSPPPSQPLQPLQLSRGGVYYYAVADDVRLPPEVPRIVEN